MKICLLDLLLLRNPKRYVVILICTSLPEGCMQDAEREKKGLMEQAEGVVRQKNEIDKEQRLLLLELNKIRGSLSDFEGRRTEKNVR